MQLLFVIYKFDYYINWCWRQPPMSSSMKLIYTFILQLQKRLYAHIEFSTHCMARTMRSMPSSVAWWIGTAFNEKRWNTMLLILFKIKPNTLWRSFSARRQRWQRLVVAFHLIIDFVICAAIRIFLLSHSRKNCEKSSIHHCIINHCVVCFSSARFKLNGPWSSDYIEIGHRLYSIYFM